MNYEDVIKGYSCEQLVCEQAILKEEQKIVYNKQKMLDEEFKRRLRNKNK